MPLIMESTPTIAAKDPAQYPLLRNLQFSPIKEGEEQYIVLWDPTGLSKERLVLPLNYFFIVQHLDGEHSVQDIGAIYLKRFGEFLIRSSSYWPIWIRSYSWKGRAPNRPSNRR